MTWRRLPLRRADAVAAIRYAIASSVCSFMLMPPYRHVEVIATIRRAILRPSIFC